MPNESPGGRDAGTEGGAPFLGGLGGTPKPTRETRVLP
jgi:hypothetical protein